MAGKGSVGSGGFVVVVVVESSAAGVIVMLGIIVKVNMVRCGGDMGREWMGRDGLAGKRVWVLTSRRGGSNKAGYSFSSFGSWVAALCRH